MRSYRLVESPADRGRGVIRIETLDYPATAASEGPAGEYHGTLGDLLAVAGVRVYRQSIQADGTTREFIIDADGDGIALLGDFASTDARHEESSGRSYGATR